MHAKMSKSRGHDRRKAMPRRGEEDKAMYAGPPRGATEPGKVEENPIFLYLDAFDPDTDEVSELKRQYESTGLGNKVLKDRLTEVLNTKLDPFRDRRSKYEANMPLVREAIEAGTKRMRTISQETMEMVRDALDMRYLERY